MTSGPTFTVAYRRKREGKTDYKARRKMLTSGKPRFVIRRSLRNLWIQAIDFTPKGDRVIASAHSRWLRRLGWKASLNSLPAAYLCGLLLGKKAKARKIVSGVLDIGPNISVKGSVWYAALKGMLDAGLQISHSKETLPKEERIKGEHIAAWAKQLKANPEKYRQAFSAYIKAGLAPEEISTHIEETRKKVLAG